MVSTVSNLIKRYKIIRFILSGGVGAFSQIAILYLFVNNLKIWYLLATAIAFCISVTVSYVLQKFFTFKNDSKNMRMQFSNFFVFAVIMFFFNVFLMYICVDILGLMYILAQIIVSILCAFISYTIFNKIIFKKTVL